MESKTSQGKRGRAAARKVRATARKAATTPPAVTVTFRHVDSSDALRAYVVSLLERTREDPRVELGASPRAGLLLLRAAKARALLSGREHALPDDVQALARSVLGHRILLGPEAVGETADGVVGDALAATPAL